MNVTKFNVQNLKGNSDISSLRDHIQSMDGVHTVRVDNEANTITVEYEDTLNAKKIEDTISEHKNTHH